MLASSQASTHPHLILAEPGAVEGHCAQLALTLGLPLKTVARAVAGGPLCMLTTKTGQLAQR